MHTTQGFWHIFKDYPVLDEDENELYKLQGRCYLDVDYEIDKLGKVETIERITDSRGNELKDFKLYAEALEAMEELERMNEITKGEYL